MAEGLCQVEESNLDPIVPGEINLSAEPRMDCRKEGQGAERPVRVLLEDPSMMQSNFTGDEGSRRVGSEGPW